jgi:hypothetical protein
MPTPTLATYAFLPWLRRGLSAQIARLDGAPSPDVHVRVPVAITMNDALTANATLALAGPGEVGGLDIDVIARVYPKPNTSDAEPNYFPLIEFEQPDLPWRQTPARATGADRLRPWLCLIVVRDEEIVALDEDSARRRLTAVTVRSANVLPKLDQSWAWAHVQISGEDAQDLTADRIRQLFHDDPDRALSRLLCPRRLDSGTSYRAFLVPTFERGRAAGLGEEPEGDGLAAAWSAASTNVRLPVYYQWRFATGTVGDFEYLARLLQARPLPPQVGTRPVDATDPGLGLPPAVDGPLIVEGALVPPGFTRGDPGGSTVDEFRERLTHLLDAAANRLADPGHPRVLGPPLYGRWPARRDRLAADPPWFAALNGDLRFRAFAGVGARVVGRLQRQLMASAWQQVAGIREANARLRYAQLARAVANRVFTRHVAAQDTSSLLGITGPLHAKVVSAGATVAGRFSSSPVPPGSAAPQLRRVMRPLGPIGRRLGIARDRRPLRIVERVNRGHLATAAAPVLPHGALTMRTAIEPSRVAAQKEATRAPGVSRIVARANRLDALAAGALTSVQLTAAPLRGVFQPSEAFGAEPSVEARIAPAPATGEAPAARRFRLAAADVFRPAAVTTGEPQTLVSAPLATLQTALVESLRPDRTFAESVGARLQLPPRGVRQPGGDPLESVMAAPQFPQPMYQPLAELSQEWILPGFSGVPPNTTTLLETNQAVVESYMVGLNDAMARELQWNEYPTDMRGTCFRQFWDVGGYAGTVAADRLRDIDEIHLWGATGLGANSARDLPPGGAFLVLLVRGELLRRYPNTVLYAVNAVRTAAGRDLGTEERHPLFRGVLQPDVTFFGFDLTADEARGQTDPQSPDQGWFFVLQEHPAEPRFGLDTAGGELGAFATAWSELSWGHLASSEADLDTLACIDLDAPLPDTRQIAASGGAAWHASSGLGPAGATSAHLAYVTLQQPMRVAIHASQMIRTG